MRHSYFDYLFFVPGILLLTALLPLPYSYYRFLRWVVFLSSGHFFINQSWQIFTYPAFRLSHTQRKHGKKVIFVFAIIMILFNPIFPFHLSRGTWMLIDLLSALVMLYEGTAYFINYGNG